MNRRVARIAHGDEASWHPVHDDHGGRPIDEGNGLMHADDTREFTAAPDDDRRQWLDLGILSAVASGASRAEIAASLSAADDPLDQAGVAQMLADLERRGFVETTAAGQLTESGRRLLLARIGECAAQAHDLESERLRVERLRTDLLSTISHELRTPLTLIRTSIGLLLDSHPDEEMRLRLLRNIKGSSDRMHALVTDLLDLARMSGDRLELQLRWVDLGELVSGAVALMRPLLDEKQQRVALVLPSPAPTVLGDYRRLERVLLNLLSNATKFAPPRSEIAVSLITDTHTATIAVRDTGPGITAAAMPQLFDQFFTERTSSSRHNIGAGLGLPIAKGIVEAHGGRIWVESTVGVGTTVSFALPLSAAEERSD